jgi:hypothetical protein
MEGTESFESPAKTTAKTVSESSATVTVDSTAETRDLDRGSALRVPRSENEMRYLRLAVLEQSTIIGVHGSIL